MERSEQLEKSLTELEKLTGLKLAITDTVDEEHSVTQINAMLKAYKERYNKEDFLLSLLRGKIRDKEAQKRGQAFHLNAEGDKFLFLLQAKAESHKEVETVLKQLFPTRTSIEIVYPGGEEVALLYYPKRKEDIATLAHTLADTINMELMIKVVVAYSEVFTKYEELHKVYEKCQLALRLGTVFTFGSNVFPSDQLGVGQLIDGLSPEKCHNFLDETFGEEFIAELTEEMRITANTFLQNNLNIAETARGLHMHRNTLIYRLEQIQKKTGLDIRVFGDALTFKVGMMVLDYLEMER
ncbi:carbohydrate diacid regulator [Lachnospiraceae bacterium PF1-21]|uniref:Helix-turn-helix domain-containing protein n=1 Tax=Ohessyouella blattaphilus TaxID=2949333 RepID=A0ABT1EHK0_9FIRM|nr:helix-turn-helix domain-containing protein [Ohessyouella blattaphilus]MCP1110169.1 helix-turn-helix domain-containing protein [Ohessyouella blattaphilus]MCR8563563.1 helix-turn-helix domain-containing protein [Ohessyouella blattaphilus]